MHVAIFMEISAKIEINFICFINYKYLPFLSSYKFVSVWRTLTGAAVAFATAGHLNLSDTCHLPMGGH